jgi:micrococcal nuclease
MPAVLLAVLLGACGTASSRPPPVNAEDPGVAVPADAFNATVMRVVDGDTLVARLAGRQVRVRLLGIDTPESVKPGTPVACFGHEASALTRALVQGRTVRAAYEVEHTDSYGRELWDVWLPDGRFLQGVIVASGGARSYPYQPNTVHADELHALMSRAHDERRGLWGTCALNRAYPQLKRQRVP